MVVTNTMLSRKCVMVGRWFKFFSEKASFTLLLTVLTFLKGCCWELSPDRTTTGLKIILCNVDNIWWKILSEIIEISLITTRSYCARSQFVPGGWFGSRKVEWTVSQVTLLGNFPLNVLAKKPVEAATNILVPDWNWWI